MHNFKRGLGLALLLFIWVLALFFASALLFSFGWIPMRYAGIAQDAIVLFGVWIFNHYLAHVPVRFWNGHHGWQQFRLALPAVIIVGLLVSANLSKLVKLPFTPLVLLYLAYVLLIGLTEEYVFRGVLLPLIARSFKHHNLVAVLLSSLLFGGLHLINSTHISLTYVLPQILFALAIGTLFASLYVATNNLGLTILLHAATDLSVVVQLIQHPTSTTNLNLSPTMSMMIAIFYGILFVFATLVAVQQTKHVTIPTEK